MQELKHLLGSNYFIYGPVTKEEAFGVTLDSRATFFNNEWYAATLSEYEPLKDKLVCGPSINEPVESEPTPE